MLLHPATEPLIDTLARAPYVVLADLGPAEAAAVDTCQQTAGVFDLLAGWVVHACPAGMACRIANAETRT